MQSTNTAQTANSLLTPNQFSVTDAAFSRIAKIRQGEPEGTYFRVEVLGGGCSGYQYNYKLEAAPLAESDLTLEKDGLKVVVDDISLGLLAGSVLDYAEDLGSAGFEIKNPNAKSGCGCGNSFSM